MQRENGFYYVKWNDEWDIGEWDGKEWDLFHWNYVFQDKDLQEIGHHIPSNEEIEKMQQELKRLAKDVVFSHSPDDFKAGHASRDEEVRELENEVARLKHKLAICMSDSRISHDD